MRRLAHEATDRRALALDVVAVAVVAAVLACYPEAQPDPEGVLCVTPLGMETWAPTDADCARLAAHEARMVSVWLDAGLTRLEWLRGVQLVTAEGTDGGQFRTQKPHYLDAGLLSLRGDAEGCLFGRTAEGELAINGKPRHVLLSSQDWSQPWVRNLLCHEGGHCLSQVPTQDHPPRGSECTDNYLFCRARLDAKCAEAAR